MVSCAAVQKNLKEKKGFNERAQRGVVENLPALVSHLETTLHLTIEKDKPLVIIYYPGKDSCNSSGLFTNERWIKNWKKLLESNLEKIAQVTPIYLYKNSEGLESHRGIIRWKRDSAGVVAGLFFKKQYPCGSFVVIAKDGTYISHLGEYPIDYVWNAAQWLHQKKE